MAFSPPVGFDQYVESCQSKFWLNFTAIETIIKTKSNGQSVRSWFQTTISPKIGFLDHFGITFQCSSSLYYLSILVLCHKNYHVLKKKKIIEEVGNNYLITHAKSLFTLKNHLFENHVYVIENKFKDLNKIWKGSYLTFILCIPFLLLLSKIALYQFFGRNNCTGN